MNRHLCLVALAFLTFAAIPSQSFADFIYAIGNSLTQDAQPLRLDGQTQNAIHCNQNLQQIWDDPSGFCGSTTTRWDTALVQNQYDFVVVQPFYGTSLAQDSQIIRDWMAMQPNAQFVIHTGWSRHADFASEYYGTFNDGMMRANPDYFDDLIADIEANTGRQVLNDHMIDVLATIYEDIQLGQSPYSQFNELYRDQIHLERADGRFLAHNTLRYRLGQPFTSDGWDSGTYFVPEARRLYLQNAIIRTWSAIPEPSSMLIGLLAVGSVPVLSRRRRAA